MISSLQNNFSLWPWSLALFFFNYYYFFIAMWEVEKAGTNHLFFFVVVVVPEKDVYNFVCILKMYCDTFNLGEMFP